MGIILEIIFNLLAEIILQTIIELLVAFGNESIANSFREHRFANKYYAVFGCILLGGSVGFISYLFYPKHIFNVKSFYGFSLIISPIVVGFIMKSWGRWRIKSKKRVSILATFWGGALFAFAYSLVRFLLIN